MLHLVLLQIFPFLAFLLIEQKVKEPEVSKDLVSSAESGTVHVDDKQVVKLWAGISVITFV